MKTKLNCFFIALALLALLTLDLQPATASAQGTAFTYQGRLNDGANPANGSYDLTFALFSVSSGAGQVGNNLTNSATAMSNGLFTVTLDFGNQFNGAARWLEIGVRTNGNGAFSTLTPRQPLTPAPYAITAGSVVSGGLNAGTYGNAVTFNNNANSFGGSFSGNGANVTNVNAATLGGLPSSNFWKTSGNAGANPTNGAYLGTIDTLPLEIKINGARALRLEYGYDFAYASMVPNLIGGYSGNVASNGVYGAFIGGGGNFSYPNRVGGSYASVLGGFRNTASGYSSTAMGQDTTASGIYSTAMGQGNTASGDYSTAMGQDTTASGVNSTAMGYFTIASGDYSTAMGQDTTASGVNSTAMGVNTTASGLYSTAMGAGTTANGYYSTAMGTGTTASGYYSTAMGYYALAAHQGSFVWADTTSFTPFSSTATNQFLIRAGGGVGINKNNPATALDVNGTVTATTFNGTSAGLGGNLSFGTQTRQMLNLYSTSYGIGVQAGTLYFRCDTSPGQDLAGFRWYRGGVHNDALGNAGGGTEMMSLVAAGVYATTFISTSDRNAKENFTSVQPREVLEKVVALPITRWNYKSDAATPHLGPVAQDFYAAFDIGPDDKHITTIDESGVALAAIQGLNQKLADELQKRDTENAELKTRLEKLEKLVNTKAGETK